MTRSTDTWPKVISNRMFIIVFVIYVAFLRLDYVLSFLFFLPENRSLRHRMVCKEIDPVDTA